MAKINFNATHAKRRVKKIIDMIAHNAMSVHQMAAALDVEYKTLTGYIAHLRLASSLTEVSRDKNTILYRYSGVYDPRADTLPDYPVVHPVKSARVFRDALCVAFFGEA